MNARAIAEQMAHDIDSRATAGLLTVKQLADAIAAALHAAYKAGLEEAAKIVDGLPPHTFTDTGERLFVGLTAALDAIRARAEEHKAK